MRRVKFFSKEDMSSGYHLDNAEEILNMFNQENSFNINDILEMHNISLYIENDMKLKSWTSKQFDLYVSKSNQMKSLVRKYFGKLTDENILNEYLLLEWGCSSDFWSLFEHYKLFNGINPSVFAQIISLKKVQIKYILENKNTVKKYGKELRNYLVSSTPTAELLINYLELKSISLKKALYFPIELSNEDKGKVLSDYIDSAEAHPNILEVIGNLKNSNLLSISDKIKLKAKKRYEEDVNMHFEQHEGMAIGTSVGFISNQSEAVKVSRENELWVFSYSKDWICDNLDYATVLNNFIYLFAFVDQQMRLLLVSKECNLGVFERFLFTSSERDYTKGIAFDIQQQIAHSQILGYYNTLLKDNVRLEEVYEWFFTTYLPFEFDVNGFKVQMPSSGSTYLEKCRTIFPEIESILKQYRLFVENDGIDQELLQISSGGVRYEAIPSILPQKYVYGKGESFETIKYHLSSDQSSLLYVEKIGEKYETFYDLISNEQIFINDFHKNNMQIILWLEEKAVLKINQDGLITWDNKNKATILYDLCINDVISYLHYPMITKPLFEELLKQEIIIFENTLFSRPESNYIDFLLNKSKYANGYDIRNRYEHGTQPDEHENFYMYALLVATTCIVKINDELSMWNSNKTDIKLNETRK